MALRRLLCLGRTLFESTSLVLSGKITEKAFSSFISLAIPNNLQLTWFMLEGAREMAPWLRAQLDDLNSVPSTHILKGAPLSVSLTHLIIKSHCGTNPTKPLAGSAHDCHTRPGQLVSWT